MNSMARRMFELVEPIGVIPYSADEPNEAMFALGFTNYWDTYFAGRAAPLGLAAAEVVDALFYNFAPGEVARHIPKVWRTTTPEAAIAARQAGCVKALRRILGDHVDSPAFARATTDALLVEAMSVVDGLLDFAPAEELAAGRRVGVAGRHEHVVHHDLAGDRRPQANLAVDRWRTTPGLNMIEYIDHGSLQMMDVPHKAALMIEIEGDADIDMSNTLRLTMPFRRCRAKNPVIRCPHG